MALNRYRVGGTVTVPAGVLSYPAAGAPATTSASTSATPAAGTVVTSQTLPQGEYLVQWNANLQTAAAAGDVNNFGLYNGSTLVATSVNSGTVGNYPQTAVNMYVPAGTVVAVKNILIGSSGSVYNSSLTITVLDSNAGKGSGAYTGPGSPAQWAEGFPVKFLNGTDILLDPSGGLYAALVTAGATLTAISSADDVGHAGLSN